jgi:hypothetical protein
MSGTGLSFLDETFKALANSNRAFEKAALESPPSDAQEATRRNTAKTMIEKTLQENIAGYLDSISVWLGISQQARQLARG